MYLRPGGSACKLQRLFWRIAGTRFGGGRRHTVRGLRRVDRKRSRGHQFEIDLCTGGGSSQSLNSHEWGIYNPSLDRQNRGASDQPDNTLKCKKLFTGVENYSKTIFGVFRDFYACINYRYNR